jgi:general secretion pathway protein D
MSLRNLCVLVLTAAVFLTGCPKGSQENNAGAKAESLNDYDTALDYYNKALQTSPNNTEYKLKSARARFEAAQWHVDQGRRLRDQGNLELALAEFRKAQMTDPSSAVAQQEVKNTTDAIAAKQGVTQNTSPAGPGSQEPKLMAGPPKMEPLSRAPINMKATNDSKAVFEAIGKLAGLTVIFDPDFTSRRISVELTNVTLEQALNISALQSKAFWRPVTANIIFVAPDQPQKRKDYEEEVVKTFYLRNTVLPQELTEIVTSIRQLLDLRRVQQINAQNAIVIRDTPDRVLLAGKIIDDIDKARPEVVIQVAIMEARRDRMRNVGITPPTSVAASFANPSTTTNSSTSSSTSTNSAATISQLEHFPGILSSGYSITMPSATASFLMTDTSTQILDDPEIRVVDGQTAKLKIGDRIPVATGSFQAGIGVGSTGTGAGVVNPLVNTQFQYLDVGVNVDVTPRIHPDREISLKVNVVVSSQTGSTNIGGINQPIISQRSIEHDIRLKDGEVNILGGLIEQTDANSTNGIAGLAKIPFFGHFLSGNTVDHEKDEILIVLIPHIVRLPSISAENLRSIASGTDTNAEVRLEDAVLLPESPKPEAALPAPQPAPAPAIAPAAANPSATQNASVRFEPGTAALKPGETTTIGVTVQNVQDLYSIPMLLQFNPAVISVEDVRQGGFLSGGTQDVAIVERVDKERGQAIISATRMPNTPGVSGSGTLVGIVIKGLAPGNSQLSIVQVNAKDSQQRPIQVVTGEATVKVQ